MKKLLTELQEIKKLLQIIVSNQKQNLEVDFKIHVEEARWTKKLPQGDVNDLSVEPIKCSFSKGEIGKEI